MDASKIKGLAIHGVAVLAIGFAIGLMPSFAATPIAQDRRPIQAEIRILFESKSLEGATVWLEGATVWLEGMSDDLCNARVQNRIESVQTPKSGCVRLTLRPDIEVFQIYARHGNGLSGLGKFRLKSNAEGGANETHRIDLNLAKTQPFQGRLFFKDKPIAGVQCKVCTLVRAMKVESNALEASMALHPGTGILGFSVSATTDQDGRFSLGGYPADCKVTLQIEKEDLGSATIELSAGKPTEWELEQPGSLAISVEGESAPIPLRNLTLGEMVSCNELRPQGRNIVQLALGTSIHREGLSAPATGEAHRGTYELNVPVDPALPYHFGPGQIVKIETGRTTSVVLKKHPLARCSGRILDAKTGKGIPHLAFQLHGSKDWNEKSPGNSRFTDIICGKTDQDGKYSLPCKGDHTYMLHFDGAGEEYDPPYWDRSESTWIPALPHRFIAAGQQASLADISLNRMRTVTATVKDNQGDLVDGPLVVYSFTEGSFGQTPCRLDQGKIVLTQLKPTLPLPFFIRKGNAVNVPTIVHLISINWMLRSLSPSARKTRCAARARSSTRKGCRSRTHEPVSSGFAPFRPNRSPSARSKPACFCPGNRLPATNKEFFALMRSGPA